MGSEQVDYRFNLGYARDRIAEISHWFQNEKGLNIEHDRKTYALKDEEPEINESLKYSEEVEELVENLDNIESIHTYKLDSFDLADYLGESLPQDHSLDYELTLVDNFTSAHLIGDRELVHPAKKVMKGKLDERESNDPVTWMQDYIDDYVDNLRDDVDSFLDDFGL